MILCALEVAMGANNIVDFKGLKDGLVIYVLKGGIDIDAMIEAINNKILDKEKFFKGAKIKGVEGIDLSDDQKIDLGYFLKTKYNMKIESLSSSKTSEEVVIIKEEPVKKEEFMAGFNPGATKFIKSTIRSGTRVEYDGSIVILGDVNPGAEIMAKGNILVLGSLRGIAHAGIGGDDKAFVISMKLHPTQLRIGEMITRSPDDYKPEYPEIAYIKGNNIIIEPIN
jgi:septum site-determining protein MinC